jgi:hypothetical protein
MQSHSLLANKIANRAIHGQRLRQAVVIGRRRLKQPGREKTLKSGRLVNRNNSRDRASVICDGERIAIAHGPKLTAE